MTRDRKAYFACLLQETGKLLIYIEFFHKYTSLCVKCRRDKRLLSFSDDEDDSSDDVDDDDDEEWDD